MSKAFLLSAPILKAAQTTAPNSNLFDFIVRAEGKPYLASPISATHKRRKAGEKVYMHAVAKGTIRKSS